MPLDPQAKQILDLINSAPGFDLEGSAAQAREFFDQMNIPDASTPVARVENRTIPGPEGEIPVRIYAPAPAEEEPGLPVLLYFHGGGFVIGSIDTHDGTCRELARGAHCMVVSVDYRLAPEHPFPAAPEDCYAATVWVAQNAAEIGADPQRIAVGGDSAGGNLAAAVTLMCRDRQGPTLCHQLLVYPVTDYAFETDSYRENADGYMLTLPIMEWFWNHYLADPAQGGDELASPLRAAVLAGLPPATVLTAEFDPLRDEGEAYARRLESAGIKTRLTRYDGVFHGFFGMGAAIDKANLAIDEACTQLRGTFTA
ncbi:MAG: alpha/beta hydrolase [Myxococcota bacterium]|nr:alpha/beta hydrolase [Myxococcota bacterium]